MLGRYVGSKARLEKSASRGLGLKQSEMSRSRMEGVRAGGVGSNAASDSKNTADKAGVAREYSANKVRQISRSTERNCALFCPVLS